MTKLFKVAAKEILKATKKAKKIEKAPHSKRGRPTKKLMTARKTKGEAEIKKAGQKIGKFKKKRTAKVVLGKKIPQTDFTKYYNQMKNFDKELDKIKSDTKDRFLKMNPILQKYKAKDKKDFKKKLKKAKAAAEGQKTKAMKDFEERGGKTFRIVGKGKNPFMTRLMKRRERKLTKEELAESVKKDRFKPSPGSLSDQERRAEKARLKKNI